MVSYLAISTIVPHTLFPSACQSSPDAVTLPVPCEPPLGSISLIPHHLRAHRIWILPTQHTYTREPVGQACLDGLGCSQSCTLHFRCIFISLYLYWIIEYYIKLHLINPFTCLCIFFPTYNHITPSISYIISTVPRNNKIFYKILNHINLENQYMLNNNK